MAAAPASTYVAKAQEFNYRKDADGITICDVRVKERPGASYTVVATGVKSGTFNYYEK